ncbi:DUF6515 family protein [Microbulbifer aestuariivivens]|uniref:DUF6515 family protein n=1 Tax=Microbulbifer aestuariivivens TaxID=1908308 RepID=UPI0031EF066D
MPAVFLLSVLFSVGICGQDLYRELPAGAVKIELRNQAYYYEGGYFYRQEGDSFRQIEPPLGATVTSVPPDSTGFYIGDDHYFLAGNGTFFLFDERGSDFTVVTPPANWRNYHRDAQAPQIPIYPQAIPPYPIAPRDQFDTPYQDYRVPREVLCRRAAANIIATSNASDNIRDNARDDRRRRGRERRGDERKYRQAYQDCMRRARNP